MKKITSLALALLLVVMMLASASCGNGGSETEAPTTAPTEAPTDAPTEEPTEEPTEAPTEAPVEDPAESVRELVNSALSKYQTYDSVEAYMLMDITMSVMGMEVEMPTEIYMAVKDAKSDSPSAYVSMAMDVLGQVTEVEIYTDGGEYAYMVMDGEGYKMMAEDADISSITSEFDVSPAEFPDEVFEGAEITENDDGSQTVIFKFDEETFSELFGDTLDSAGDSLGADEGTEVTITDAGLSITVKDGDLVNISMAYGMEFVSMGEAGTGTMTLDIEYLNFGDKVAVTPPEGYLDFIDLTEPEN